MGKNVYMLAVGLGMVLLLPVYAPLHAAGIGLTVAALLECTWTCIETRRRKRQQRLTQ